MHLHERRAHLLASIPPGYSGHLHLAGVTVGALLAIAGCLAALRSPAWWELALVPAFLAFANLFEWWVHRGPLHRPTRGLRRLYDRHARAHHVVFVPGRLQVESARELQLVLFPPWVVPVLLVVISPLPVGLWLLVSPDAAWLFLAAALAYYLLYEWLHLLHHWPLAGRLGRSRVVAALRQHHLAHHDPARMLAGNFNVSFPLWDRLLGTTLPPGAGAGAGSPPG